MMSAPIMKATTSMPSSRKILLSRRMLLGIVRTFSDGVMRCVYLKKEMGMTTCFI